MTGNEARVDTIVHLQLQARFIVARSQGMDVTFGVVQKTTFSKSMDSGYRSSSYRYPPVDPQSREYHLADHKDLAVNIHNSR